MSAYHIHKFGGSSLADAACFERVAGIVLDADQGRTGVVVSAMGGMTDALLALPVRAEQGDDGFREGLHAIGRRYAATAGDVLAPDVRAGVLDAWQKDADDILMILDAVAAARSATPRNRDVVAGFGEIWSARLLAALLGSRDPARGGRWLDAREVITVLPTELGPSVNWSVSRRRFASALPADISGITVITGFIAVDEEGLQTTLGRNGSDYSAAIFASLCNAGELTIWTDVNGVMSADPNRVPEARVIGNLTYNEAMELAYFGAKVLHPQTMGPVVEQGIPVRIRNSRNPAHAGSRISAQSEAAHDIKGITAIGDMALVNLEGAGMIGVPGTADRLFRALKDAGVSVTLISQASSEHSICIAVPAQLASRARAVVRDAFAAELSTGQIQKVDVTDAQSIVAVVGDGMAGTPGVAARFFGTLGRAGINIRAIAQGSSERNISAVVDSADATRALRAAHSGFYLSQKTLSIGIIGAGTVGNALIGQLAAQAGRVADSFNIDLRVRAIARSSVMTLGERRIELGRWLQNRDRIVEDIDLDRFADHIDPDHLPHAVIVDCTAENSIAQRYPQWLARGIHVVTPNKKAFSGNLELYDELQAAAARGRSHCLYETTVGAGLPVISTLRELIDTGDRIDSVEGILSGTLAWLFNVFDGSRPFSAIVREAQASGYTEPDPRDDLSGMDVARKLTILGRELGTQLGRHISIGEFPVESLVPAPLVDVSVDEFLDRLPEFDDDIAARFEAARASDRQLRYVARLDASGNASVGLIAVDDQHPFSNINLTDNVVRYQTDRYSANPLVVQGPGAGPEVTAGGVFADLLRLARYIDSGD